MGSLAEAQLFDCCACRTFASKAAARVGDTGANGLSAVVDICREVWWHQVSFTPGYVKQHNEQCDDARMPVLGIMIVQCAFAYCFWRHRMGPCCTCPADKHRGMAGGLWCTPPHRRRRGPQSKAGRLRGRQPCRAGSGCWCAGGRLSGALTRMQREASEQTDHLEMPRRIKPSRAALPMLAAQSKQQPCCFCRCLLQICRA